MGTEGVDEVFHFLEVSLAYYFEVELESVQGENLYMSVFDYIVKKLSQNLVLLTHGVDASMKRVSEHEVLPGLDQSFIRFLDVFL